MAKKGLPVQTTVQTSILPTQTRTAAPERTVTTTNTRTTTISTSTTLPTVTLMPQRQSLLSSLPSTKSLQRDDDEESLPNPNTSTQTQQTSSSLSTSTPEITTFNQRLNWRSLGLASPTKATQEPRQTTTQTKKQVQTQTEGQARARAQMQAQLQAEAEAKAKAEAEAEAREKAKAQAKAEAEAEAKAQEQEEQGNIENKVAPEPKLTQQERKKMKQALTSFFDRAFEVYVPTDEEQTASDRHQVVPNNDLTFLVRTEFEEPTPTKKRKGQPLKGEEEEEEEKSDSNSDEDDSNEEEIEIKVVTRNPMHPAKKRKSTEPLSGNQLEKLNL